VLGHIETPPADETTAYNPGDIYQESKTAAEKWLIDYAKTSELPYTIVRPAAIYGPGDRRLLKLFKMAKLPLIPLIGFTDGLYHLIHVEDLVSFIHFVSTQPETNRNIYICGSPTPNSIKNLLTIIRQHSGNKARFLRIPATPIFLIARLVEIVSKALNVEPILFPRRIAFFTKDRAFDTSKMQALTGFEYEYSDHRGITELADWYRSENWL
jgi:nucleoside-diphosphate-sugar epimerase